MLALQPMYKNSLPSGVKCTEVVNYMNIEILHFSPIVAESCVVQCVCSHFLLFPALQKKPEEINRRSADMWSFAILLWELVTREVPYADLSNMEIGMKVSRATVSLAH